jgi:phosphohistidine phosphatase
MRIMTMPAEQDRRLVLLRHAKSAWPDVPDHDRPLARRGQRDAPAVGRWLRTADMLPDLVVCSTAQRARETWQLAQTGLGAAPPVRFDDRVYESSATHLLALIHREPPTVRTLLVIGHDPAISGLALALAEDTAPDTAPAEMLDRMRAKFPTAALAVLACTGTWNALSPETARLTCFRTPGDHS